MITLILQFIFLCSLRSISPQDKSASTTCPKHLFPSCSPQRYRTKCPSEISLTSSEKGTVEGNGKSYRLHQLNAKSNYLSLTGVPYIPPLTMTSESITRVNLPILVTESPGKYTAPGECGKRWWGMLIVISICICPSYEAWLADGGNSSRTTRRSSPCTFTKRDMRT